MENGLAEGWKQGLWASAVSFRSLCAQNVCEQVRGGKYNNQPSCFKHIISLDLFPHRLKKASDLAIDESLEGEPPILEEELQGYMAMSRDKGRGEPSPLSENLQTVSSHLSSPCNSYTFQIIPTTLRRGVMIFVFEGVPFLVSSLPSCCLSSSFFSKCQNSLEKTPRVISISFPLSLLKECTLKPAFPSHLSIEKTLLIDPLEPQLATSDVSYLFYLIWSLQYCISAPVCGLLGWLASPLVCWLLCLSRTLWLLSFLIFWFTRCLHWINCH